MSDRLQVQGSDLARFVRLLRAAVVNLRGHGESWRYIATAGVSWAWRHRK